MISSSTKLATKKFIQQHYDINLFYFLHNKKDCTFTLFFVRHNVSLLITICDDPIIISGVCEAYPIYDSNVLHIGYVFVTLKARTKVTPLSLSIKIPPDQDDYVEIDLPPKFGVLAYKSSNGSTLVIAQEALNLQYIVKDVEN